MFTMETDDQKQTLKDTFDFNLYIITKTSGHKPQALRTAFT